MTPQTVLIIGGILHLGWALFHLGFPRIFKWESALASLDLVQSGIMRIMNLCLVFVFLALAYLSLVHGSLLLAPGLGRIMVSLTAAFWLFRFILQLVYFKLSHPVSAVLSVFFVLTGLCYAYPFLRGAVS